MTALRYDRPAALLPHRVERRPYHAWIEDDGVVASILRQQDVCEQRNDVCARDELTFFSEEHRAIRVRVPRDTERRALFSDQVFCFGTIAGQHRIRWSFWKRTVGFEVQRYEIQSELLREVRGRSAHVTEVRIADEREFLDHARVDRLQDVLEIVVEYVAFGAGAFLVRLNLGVFAGFEYVAYFEET